MPWLHEMKWPEVAEYLKKKRTILIPIGSTEQHGRHAPLGNDSFVAVQLAEDAAEEAHVICAPPLFFSWSPHHMVLPGTISIEPAVLVSFLFDEIKSLSVHGFKNFVVINGHRQTNLPWMQIGAHKSQDELGVRVVLFDPAYMSREIVSKLGFGPIGHAGEIETSHMLHIRPELISMDDAVDAADWATTDTPFYHVDPGSVEDTLYYVPSDRSTMKKAVEETGGCTGKPSRSSADLGRQYHEHLVRRLVALIEHME